MCCVDVFLSAGLLWPELSTTCEEVKLASGSGAKGANKVKYYHNSLQGPRNCAVIGGKTQDPVNDLICVFVLQESLKKNVNIIFITKIHVLLLAEKKLFLTKLQ